MFGSLFTLPVGEQIFSECLNGAQNGEGPNKKINLLSLSIIGSVRLCFLHEGSFYKTEYCVYISRTF